MNAFVRGDKLVGLHKQRKKLTEEVEAQPGRDSPRRLLSRVTEVAQVNGHDKRHVEEKVLWHQWAEEETPKLQRAERQIPIESHEVCWRAR